MRRISSLFAIPVVLVCLALAPTMALADAPTPSEVRLGFSPAAPATNTTLTLDATYRDPSDPNAKPPAITTGRFEFPTGTRFNTDKLPVCKATDLQFQVLGRAACPTGSQVATGDLTGYTGLPAVDRIGSDLVAYNTGDGFVVVAFVPDTPVVFATDRNKVSGNVDVAQPPFVPGGLPDLRTVVRNIRLSFPADAKFVTTPSTCPENRAWQYKAVLSFADQTTQVIDGTIPCTR